MSRTYKDKPSKLLWGDHCIDFVYTEPFGYRLGKTSKPKLRKSKNDNWKWYNTTPSWWNHLFHTKPRRQQSRIWSVKVVKSSLEEGVLDELDTPNYSNKPHRYYY